MKKSKMILSLAVLLLVSFICISAGATTEVTQSDAMHIERLDMNDGDDDYYGYEGVWFYSPTSGISVYIPGEWTDHKRVLGDRKDGVAFAVSSYDEKFGAQLLVDYSSARNAAELKEYMEEHDWGKNHKLINAGNGLELLYYEQRYKNDSSDWDANYALVNGNGFAYTFRLTGGVCESLEEENTLDSILKSLTILSI